jgi:hypothetical protein
MLARSDPHLRTGGAVLLASMLLVGEYELPDEHVADLLEHVLLTDLMVESFDQQADNLGLALLILAEVADDHGEAITEKFAPVQFDRYLHGQHAGPGHWSLDYGGCSSVVQRN